MENMPNTVPVITAADASAEAFSAYIADQRKYQCAQSRLSIIRTVAMVVLVAAVGLGLAVILPRYNSVMNQMQSAAAQIETVAAQVEQLDLLAMTESVTKLATDGSSGIESALVNVSSAMEKIDQLDIKGLNRSINDLGKVMGPIARLFGK
ncbi:MAG: hypothetical protein RR232_07040 [Clostridia bacterium]